MFSCQYTSVKHLSNFSDSSVEASVWQEMWYRFPVYWLRNSFTGKTLLSVGFIDRSQNTGIEAVCVGNLMRSCVHSTYTQTHVLSSYFIHLLNK